MFDFADKAFVLLTALGTAGILGILHVAASSAAHEVQAHDLRIRVHQLRQEKLARLRKNAAPDATPAVIIEPEPEQRAA
jgi:hypothetical protein